VRDVLFIDDDPGISAALSTRLRAHGYSVRVASDGLQGLDEARRVVPDVVVLDIRMPGIDGLEVCRRLRADSATRSVPVLFLSAEARDDIREAAAAAGGSHYLGKPFDAKEVVAVIKHLIDHAECTH